MLAQVCTRSCWAVACFQVGSYLTPSLPCMAAIGCPWVLQDLFVDDCIIDKLPIVCFSYAGSGGAIEVYNSTIADAGCTSIKQSVGIAWLLKSAAMARGSASNYTYLDDRSVYIHDTHRVPAMVKNAHWRFVNTTLTCTGGLTHPHPHPRPHNRALDGPSNSGSIQLSVLATLAAGVMAVWVWASRRRRVIAVTSTEMPEVSAARAKGILLEAVIGQGTFGQVYCAQYKGMVVAVKVLQFPAAERSKARRVMRECQISASCCHPNIVAHITFFTITVRRRLMEAPAQLSTCALSRPPPLSAAHEM